MREFGFVTLTSLAIVSLQVFLFKEPAPTIIQMAILIYVSIILFRSDNKND